MTKTSTTLTFSLIAIVSFAACANSSQAALTTVADYDFGDNMTPAGFSEVGTPNYSGGQLVLDGTNAIFNTSTPLTATDNFVVEAIVNATSFLGPFDFVVANSNGVVNQGFGILYDNADWSGIHMGQALFGNSAAATGTNVALAVVRDGGTSQLYVNGVAIPGTYGPVPVAPTRLNIGYNPADGIGNSGFNGAIARVRLSTITGSFDPNDLLGPNDGAITPEPTAMTLLGIACMGLLASRRRRTRS